MMRSVLEAVRLLHGCEDHDALAERYLAAVRQVVACDAVFYTEVNVARRRAVHQSGDPVRDREVALLNPVYEQLVHEHPLVGFAMRDPVPVTKVSDFLSQPGLRRLGLYHEFFRPLGVDRQIGVCLSGEPELAIGVAICRQRPREDFDERDRKRLTLLRPHLIEAYRGVSALVDLRECLLGRDLAMNAAGVGVLNVDAGGRITFETSAARAALVGAFPGGANRAETLPEPVAAWFRAVTAALDRLDQPGAANAVNEFTGPAGTLRIRLLVGEGRARFTLLLRYREAVDPVPKLRRDGLTRREAEVLYRLTLGETNAAIARALDIGHGTARIHVERVLAKLGVSTRTAAARVALGWLNEML